MSLRLDPELRLGADLMRLCRKWGLHAGISPVRVDAGPQPPSRSYEWSIQSGLGTVRMGGCAPSLEAARADLRSGLRSLGVV